MQRRIGLALAATIVLAAGCSQESPTPPAAPSAVDVADAPSVPFEGMEAPEGARPKSVVLVIADGMGPQQVALLLDWAEAADAGIPSFQYLAASGTLGIVRTGASNSPLTDSASSATALATGVESYNGAIGVDDAKEAVATCLEDAQKSGRRTGLVSTTRLTHATPAAFASHVARRNLEAEIATQLLASGVNVMLGGGGRFVKRAAGEAAGYTVVDSEEGLNAVPTGTDRLLGVFADSHLPYFIDRDGVGDPDDAPQSPTLAELTSRALEVLEGPQGFFLMIEAGRIDHAGHINDVAGVLGELREFDDALEVLIKHQLHNPDTLVVVTADHETGGLAITQGGAPLRPEHFLEMAKAERSLEAIARDEPEKETVDSKATFGVGRRHFYPPYSWWETSRALERSAQYNVSYASQTHTTTPVVCIAVGPGQEHFGGLYHNERIGRLMRFFMMNEARE